MGRSSAALKYSPDQDRVPAGSPEGGQFSGGDPGIASGAGTKVHRRGSHTLPGRYDRVPVPAGGLIVTSDVGYIVLSPATAVPGTMWVNHSRVAPESRGKGEGTRLYNAALKAVQKAGGVGILRGGTKIDNFLISAEAVRLWDRFKKEGRVDQAKDTDGYMRDVLVRPDPREAKAYSGVAKYAPDQPRDEAGRWTDGGGGESSAAPTASAAHVTSSPEFSRAYRVFFYASAARLLAKYSEDQPRDDHGRWTDAGGGGGSDDIESVRHVGRVAGVKEEDGASDPPRPGEPFLVYRLQHADENDLANSNAGNARGVAEHIARIDDHEKPQFVPGNGDTVVAYRVVSHREFGAYRPSLRSTTEHEADAVGRQNKNGAVSYFFPRARGERSWEAERVGSVSLGTVRRVLQDLHGHESFDDAGTRAGSEAIRVAFQQRSKALAKYAPDQPRDDHGRWTDGGGGVAVADGPVVGEDHHEFLAEPGDAEELLARGQRVTVAQEDVLPLLERMADRSDHPDLTNLHVDGLHIFGGGEHQGNGLGFTRGELPQIPGAHRDEFIAGLKAQGIGVSDELISPLSLSPSQNEISASKVGGMLRRLTDPGSEDVLKPIFVSADNYILDGHHRWATIAALASEQYDLLQPVTRIRLGVDDAFDAMRIYAREHGIANKPHGKGAVAKYSDDQPRDEAGRWVASGGAFDLASTGYSADQALSSILRLKPLNDGLSRAESYTQNPLAATSTDAEKNAASEWIFEHNTAPYGWKREMVPASQISSFQKYVVRENMERYAPKLDDILRTEQVAAFGFKHGGKVWLQDGNHRANLLILGGAKEVPMFIRAPKSSKSGAPMDVPPGFTPSPELPEPDETIEEKRVKYSDDQPRDDHGRWTDGGGGEPVSSTVEPADPDYEGPDERWAREKLTKDAATIAASMKMSDVKIDVVNIEPRPFEVGSMQFREAGHYDPNTERIEVNVREFLPGYGEGGKVSDPKQEAFNGLVVHELTHAQFDEVLKTQKREHEDLAVMARNDPSDYDRLFKKNGYPRDTAWPELRERFPASVAMAESFNDVYLGPEDAETYDGRTRELRADDGVSQYSKAYWDAVAGQGDNVHTGTLVRAINETLAEANRQLLTGTMLHGDKPVSDRWRKFVGGIAGAYRQIKAKRAKS